MSRVKDEILTGDQPAFFFYFIKKSYGVVRLKNMSSKPVFSGFPNLFAYFYINVTMLKYLAGFVGIGLDSCA